MQHRINNILSIINFNILIRLPILFIIIILTFYFDELKEVSITQFFKGLGAIVAIWLLYLRFKTTDDMKKNQEEQFHLSNQYGHFLETSKLLTDKDSTIEAKISAMYLLYDYAKNHPQEVEKVYQLLSEYIKPLLNCIDNNCPTKKYNKIKNNIEVQTRVKKMTYNYSNKKVLNFDIENGASVKTITSWQRSGTETEKLVSVSLIMIRDITMNILQKARNHIELSNIIIFNYNIDYSENSSTIKFKSILRPTYSLVFLDCNLKGVDFSESKFYYCKFINCDLDRANFNGCDLKETKFIVSDLSDTQFDNCKLDRTTFEKCTNRFLVKLKKITWSSKQIKLTLLDFQYHYNEFCK